MPYVQKRFGLRSNNLNLLSLPSADLKSYGSKAFSFGAVVEWNKLPLDLRQSPYMYVFKSRLKTYLFEKCYMADCKLCLLSSRIYLFHY